MTFREYIINYNSFEGQNEDKMIDMHKIDLSEEKELAVLMDKYVEMLREKIRRKRIARDEETFILSGTNQEERYMYDSIAGVYIYENQFERKEIQSEIAELTGLSREQVEKRALRSFGRISTTEEEKREVAKLLSLDYVEEQEPNV